MGSMPHGWRSVKHIQETPMPYLLGLDIGLGIEQRGDAGAVTSGRGKHQPPADAPLREETRRRHRDAAH